MDATADLEEYKFMFKQRLISGIILVLIAAFGLYMGGNCDVCNDIDRCIDRIQRDFKDLSY